LAIHDDGGGLQSLAAPEVESGTSVSGRRKPVFFNTGRPQNALHSA
jgi:hypothetical protein